MWPKVRAENPDSPLWDLGKVIGQLWNSASPAEKSIYQQEYEADKVSVQKKGNDLFNVLLNIQ